MARQGALAPVGEQLSWGEDVFSGGPAQFTVSGTNKDSTIYSSIVTHALPVCLINRLSYIDFGKPMFCITTPSCRVAGSGQKNH